MNKKFEYHKEYPKAVYKDRVYRWFNDNTSTLCDADLQKFVDDAMQGKLTFQCADEIDIDDPDISMIDHLLMDIASEKNDELINTYTDEIDWDNDYIENYNKGCNMDKKLEARIARLEEMLFEDDDRDLARVRKALNTLSSIRQMAEDIEMGLYNANTIDRSIEPAVMNLNEAIYNLIQTLQNVEAIYRREVHNN